MMPEQQVSVDQTDCKKGTPMPHETLYLHTVSIYTKAFTLAELMILVSLTKRLSH